jgi:hypothetical protein
VDSGAFGVGGIIYSIGGMAPIGAGQGLLRQSVRTTSILLMRGDEEGVVVGVKKVISRDYMKGFLLA